MVLGRKTQEGIYRKLCTEVYWQAPKKFLRGEKGKRKLHTNQKLEVLTHTHTKLYSHEIYKMLESC